MPDTAPLTAPVISSQALSEIGTIGLEISAGYPTEERVHKALRWPLSKDTFNKMSYDPTIAAANATIKAFVRKATFKVKVRNTDPTQQQLDQIEFVEECMHDMETSFNDVMQEALSFLTYGFSVHEKVFKYRNQVGRHKSLYDDNRVGWAKLPVRSQHSINRFRFDKKGRNLVSIEQDLSLINHQYDYEFGDGYVDPKIDIKRKKVLHFRHDPQRNNPEGRSPLRYCYESWTYKTQIERFQAIGISRDLGGIPIMRLPAEYMSPDASEDKRLVYEMFKNIVRNLHFNEQAGLVLPTFFDEKGNQLFEFELLSNTGTKQYDTDKIISSYDNKILMTYMADVLKLGQDASGSFALSDNKTNLLAVGIHSIVDELLQEFNHDLIPQTLRMNGWKLNNDLPRITLEELDDVDLEVLGQYLQRVAATGLLEADEGLADALREVANLPAVDRTKKLTPEMVAGGASESGKGMANGLSNTNGNSSTADPSTANRA